MPDRKSTIKKELMKLLVDGFIREIQHLEWLANPVLVKKNSEDWRMCIDYTNLNKHCPKDPFGMPWIDQIVDNTMGYTLLFVDTQKCLNVVHGHRQQVTNTCLLVARIDDEIGS